MARIFERAAKGGKTSTARMYSFEAGLQDQLKSVFLTGSVGHEVAEKSLKWQAANSPYLHFNIADTELINLTQFIATVTTGAFVETREAAVYNGVNTAFDERIYSADERVKFFEVSEGGRAPCHFVGAVIVNDSDESFLIHCFLDCETFRCVNKFDGVPFIALEGISRLPYKSFNPVAKTVVTDQFSLVAVMRDDSRKKIANAIKTDICEKSQVRDKFLELLEANVSAKLAVGTLSPNIIDKLTELRTLENACERDKAPVIDGGAVKVSDDCIIWFDENVIAHQLPCDFFNLLAAASLCWIDSLTTLMFTIKGNAILPGGINAGLLECLSENLFSDAIFLYAPIAVTKFMKDDYAAFLNGDLYPTMPVNVKNVYETPQSISFDSRITGRSDVVEHFWRDDEHVYIYVNHLGGKNGLFKYPLSQFLNGGVKTITECQRNSEDSNESHSARNASGDETGGFDEYFSPFDTQTLQ